MAPKRTTKGAHLSSRNLPEKLKPVAQEKYEHDPAQGANLYALLGVSPDVEHEELKLAYRQKALVEHPDKGGDQDRFDAIFYAFGVLQDPAKRLEYDEQLLAACSAVRVEGRPEHRSTGEGVAHAKTAPTAGSKRQKDWHKHAEQWEGEKSGAVMLRTIRHALTDAAGPELSEQSPEEALKAETEALFKKFSELPANSKAKQKWVDSLTGKQKQALKTRAKAHEAEAMQKAKKWLAK